MELYSDKMVIHYESFCLQKNVNLQLASYNPWPGNYFWEMSFNGLNIYVSHFMSWYDMKVPLGINYTWLHLRNFNAYDSHFVLPLFQFLLTETNVEITVICCVPSSQRKLLHRKKQQGRKSLRCQKREMKKRRG